MDKPNNVLYGNFDEDYITITRGDGVYVFDENNKKYLDAAGGVCVVNIGHGVKEIQEVVSKQVKELAYTYGGTTDNIPRQKLAKKLDQHNEERLCPICLEPLLLKRMWHSPHCDHLFHPK